MHFIKAVIPATIMDPTGCGDAFRAGVLAGLREGKPIELACEAGALLATYNLEAEGTQTHHFEIRDFSARLDNSFGQKWGVTNH